MKINLLPKEERPLKQSEVRWEFLVGLIAFLALGTVLLFSWLEQGQVASLTQDLNQALVREATLQKQVQTVQALRASVSSLEEQKQARLALLSPESQSLRILPQLMGHGIANLWIEGVTWREEQVELSGYTRSMTSLSQFLNYLNELSEEAILAVAHPLEDFVVFMVEVKGVPRSDSAPLN